MLGQRLRSWFSIDPELGECLVFAGTVVTAGTTTVFTGILTTSPVDKAHVIVADIIVWTCRGGLALSYIPPSDGSTLIQH